MKTACNKEQAPYTSRRQNTGRRSPVGKAVSVKQKTTMKYDETNNII